jgi:hypothetical protein
MRRKYCGKRGKTGEWPFIQKTKMLEEETKIASYVICNLTELEQRREVIEQCCIRY